MPWGRLDDSLYDHPKLDELGPHRLAGVGLWSVCISWCNRRLTDGFVPEGRIRQLGGTLALAERLVTAGLFDRAEGGYLIHDFLDFNDSRADVERKREQRRDAGRLGGLARSSGSLSTSPSDSLSDSPRSSASSRPVPSRPDQIPPHPLPADDDLWSLYRGMTRAVSLKPSVVQWLERLEEAHTAPVVAAALTAEYAIDPMPKTLLSRSQARLELAARQTEVVRAKQKRNDRIIDQMQARRVEMFRATGKWDPAWGEPPEAA